MAKIRLRRKKTPAEHAFDTLRSAFKLWASTKAAKAGSRAVRRATQRRRSPLLGVGLLAGGAVAAKKLRGRGGSQPAYSPPPPASTTPREDPGRRDAPHGDVAADLLPGDGRAAAAGGRSVGTGATGGAEPAGTTGTGGGAGSGSSAAPPAGTGGTSAGSPSDVSAERSSNGPSTIAPGTPAGTDAGGDVPPVGPPDPDEGSDAPPPSIPPKAS